MSAYTLPRALEFGGRSWAINADFRDVLTILEAFDDPELTDEEKAFVCIHNLYTDAEEIPRDQLQEAYAAAVAFIDNGEASARGPKTMDWQQDAKIIFPAVNRVAGYEVRDAVFLHWWTFLGMFMEINKDTTASNVFALRQKKARGKKLEKWEKEYWEQNKALCQLHPRLTDEEKAEKERLNAILG